MAGSDAYEMVPQIHRPDLLTAGNVERPVEFIRGLQVSNATKAAVSSQSRRIVMNTRQERELQQILWGNKLAR